MNRILPLLSLPLLSLAAAFAANTPEHIGNDLKLFKDSSCTSLKPDVKDTSAFQSDAMKELAAKILAGHYKPDYLYAEYRALPSPRQTGKNLQNRRRIQQIRQHDGRLSGKGAACCPGRQDGGAGNQPPAAEPDAQAGRRSAAHKRPQWLGIAQKADSAQGRNQHH